VLLGAIVVIGAALRVWFPYRNVFTAGFVNWQTHDSWYHMRLIDYAARNFPYALGNDAFAAPGGQRVPIGPLFDWMVAGAAQLLGAGHPSTGLLEAVAAYAPVALALVTIVAVFAVGRRLFDSLVGLFAAALLATMPGAFLERTMLGYVDHHAAEACFSTLALLGLCWAADRARMAGAFSARDTAIRSAIAGLALGAYLLTWTSGAFLLFILTVWIAVQYALDHAKGKPSGRLVFIVLPALPVAAALLIAFEQSDVPQHGMRLVALAGTGAALVTLEVLRRLAARVKSPLPYFLAGAVIGAFAGGVAIRLAAPGLYRAIVDNVARLAPGATAMTVGEAQPLAWFDDLRSFTRAWIEFRTGFFLAAPGIVLLARDVWRQPREGRVLLMVWSVIALAATLGQNRFGYYLAIELALLAGWISARVLRWAGAHRLKATWGGDAAVVVVSAIVFYPNVPAAIEAARRNYGMPPAWHGAMTWMRDATPEPFGNPEAYTQQIAESIRPAYAVMNWWDYGYWLMRDAHRVPLANPTQFGAADAGAFFTATDPAAAFAKLRAAGARYILTGEELPMRNSAAPGRAWQRWFPAMAVWAGRPTRQYFEPLYQQNPDGTTSPAMVYYPDYFRSMTMRLYRYGGRAADQESATAVIRLAAGRSGGRGVQEIAEIRLFSRYSSAEQYLEARRTGAYRLVCLDPNHTCIPLEAVPGQRIVYESPGRSAAFGVPSVRVFEIDQ